MSNTKTVMGQASNQYVAPTDITDVFSTYLYEGTSASKTITNGLDLGGEGGLVWIKKRNESTNSDHMLYDTERGPNERLFSNDNGRSYTRTDQLNSFDSDGFTLGADSPASPNTLGKEYVSWSFRKAPKFFDVVTWTGTGVAGKTVSHSLGSVPGMIIVKRTNTSGSWIVYHRGLNNGNSPEDYGIILNTAAGQTDQSLYWNDTAPTDTNFTLGSAGSVNASGSTYVAYVFAHNNGDGGFGPDADQDIIKCGNYAGNGSDARTIDLGFEAQWVLLKRSDGSTDWFMLDNMRGLPVRSESSQYLEANTANAEAATGQVFGDNQGFMVDAGDYNSSGENYIYIAIRRGTKVPENGTEVFAINTGTGTIPTYVSGFPVDMSINRQPSVSTDNRTGTRLTGNNRLVTNSTAAQASDNAFVYDYMDGWSESYANSTHYSWMWKRASGFFDVVAYTGNGTAGHTVSHNLGVAPEMMWVKRRNTTDVWVVYSEAVGNTGFLRLNQTNAITTTIQSWNNTSPTISNFTLGDWAAVNTNASTYIAYLFASLPGISKVGSYTGTGQAGGNINVDCGFSSGARFVLIKRTDASGGWWFADTSRGIVSGNEPLLALDSSGAEVTGFNMVEPYSSGFTVNGSGVGSDNSWNDAGGNYIFYAIA